MNTFMNNRGTTEMGHDNQLERINNIISGRFPMYRSNVPFETWLHDRTDGAIERVDGYLDMLQSYGYLEGEGSLVDGYSELPGPEGVDADIEHRLSGLDPLTREVLGHGSVEGERFTIGVLGSLCDCEGGELQHAIEQGIDAGVIRREKETGGNSSSAASTEYRFVPLKMRELLYASLDPKLRIRLHSRIVEHLGHRLQQAVDSNAEPGERSMLEGLISEHNRHASRPDASATI